MEPQLKRGTLAPRGALLVNSNLVSLSIVADARYKYAPVKVDLSAPVELVFRHLAQPTSVALPAADASAAGSGASRCVYWDATQR